MNTQGLSEEYCRKPYVERTVTVNICVLRIHTDKDETNRGILQPLYFKLKVIQFRVNCVDILYNREDQSSTKKLWESKGKKSANQIKRVERIIAFLDNVLDVRVQRKFRIHDSPEVLYLS